MPPIEPDLPITPLLPDIQATLSSQQNLILTATPGAGKSTQVPLALLKLAALQGQNILMLQPRRIAAKSIANFLAQQLGQPVGKTVGYRVRNESKCSADTRLEVVTEGILARRLQQDPELEGVGLVIFDEFHERSLQADLGLMLCLEVQQGLREDLKILVMSATLDVAVLHNYLPSAAKVSSEGRSFPVEVIRPKVLSKQLQANVLNTVKLVLAEQADGDILVFLPGRADISRCMQTVQEQLSHEHALECVPLYGGLTLAQQQAALLPSSSGQRKCIFSTNIAETSLTVQGVTAVIDSGLEKRAVFDPGSGMTRLQSQWISLASAIQRQGRAGRLAPGICVRLWDLATEQRMRPHQPPEIQEADLAPLALQLAEWGEARFTAVNWITEPPKAHYSQAMQLLENLALLDGAQRITKLGLAAVQQPLHPRLACMAQKYSSKSVAVTCLAAMLNEPDCLRDADTADIAVRWQQLLYFLRRGSKGINPSTVKVLALQQVQQQVSASLNRQLSASDLNAVAGAEPYLGRWLLCAFPDRVAKKRPGSPNRYLMANGRGVSLDTHDPLCREDWLVVVDCDAQKKEGRIFQAAAVTLEDILQTFKPQCQWQEQVIVDNDKQKLSFVQVLSYHALILEQEELNQVDSGQKHQAICNYIKDNGIGVLPWSPQCEEWLQRAQWLGSVSDNFTKVTRDSLSESLPNWLLPYLPKLSSLQGIAKIDLLPLLQAVFSYDELQSLEQHAPKAYQAPTGRHFPIRYSASHDPIVSLPLQEVFGQIESPLLAFNQVPLCFELLSPARRPLQTTSDLKGFWQSSYHDVAKEMRGRYPKHRWPEKPLEEKPGKSIKHPRK